jgi:predicted DNA-binding transcriptional regulator AlpA
MAARTVDGPEQEWLTLEEVCQRVRLRDTKIRELMKLGLFPRPRPRYPGEKKLLWHWLAVYVWEYRRDHDADYHEGPLDKSLEGDPD